VTNGVLAEVESALRLAYGEAPTRASTAFVGVEPIEVMRFVTGDLTSYVSLGMSRRPMSAADNYTVDEQGPRAELLVQTRGDGGEVWRRLTVLAAAPVVEGVVYSEGMSVDLGVVLDPMSACTGALITASALPPIPTSEGPVDVLRVLPATSTELAWSRVHGSPALLERWDERHTDLLDLRRSAVDLT
jgi:hypothetical protein